MQDITWDPPETDEVREHTRASSNRRIDDETQSELDIAASSTERARARIAELDREWTVDRALMLNFAVIGGLSAGLAMQGLRRHGRLNGWGYFFWTQVGFLAHHAIRRWCPPLPVFRRLGFRSENEIARERVLLERALQQP